MQEPSANQTAGDGDMLTRQQHKLLVFIDRHLKQSGVSPTFDEMATGLRLASKSGVHRIVSALEERGFLARRHNRARALEVLRLPQDLVRREGVIGDTPESATRSIANDMDVVQVPFYGRIAAGFALEALHATGDNVAVPAILLPGEPADHYALSVDGDSMQDHGIQHGDIVVIRRDAQVTDGQIGVASVAGGATLKRIRRQGYTLALESGNPKYPTRVFPSENVAIHGQMVALMRRYSLAR
jgi:repressor LexA